MSDAACTAWRTWVASEAAEIHIRVVIARRFTRRSLQPSDVDNLVQDVLGKLLEEEADYDPTRGAPSTFGSAIIPGMISDIVKDWRRLFPDRYRAVRLARRQPEQDEEGNEKDPPGVEGMPDQARPAGVARDERNALIHAALATLDVRTQDFARRIMDEGMPPREAGAWQGWNWRETDEALDRMRRAVTQAGITAGDRP